MAEYPTVHDSETSLLKKITTNSAQIADGTGGGGGGGDAVDTSYDNTNSGLTATEVQAAIDEAVDLINERIESIEDSVNDGQVIVFNGASGKSGKKATGTGVAKIDNGVLGVVTIGSGLDYTGSTLSATGSSGTKTLERFSPLSNQAPASNFAVVVVRNGIFTLSFDASTDQAAVFSSIIPEAADFTTGISVIIKWIAASATSGDCIWTSAFERGNTDLDSDSFATAVSATTTTNGTSGIPNTTTINHSGSEIDGLTAGDFFRLKITRDADNGSDNMTGSAQILAIEVRQR